MPGLSTSWNTRRRTSSAPRRASMARQRAPARLRFRSGRSGRDFYPERLPRIDRGGCARTVACDLHDHGLIRGRAVPMGRPSRMHHEAASRHRHGVLHVEDVTGTGIPCPLKHRHAAGVGMPMWSIHHVRWKLRPDDVEPRLVGVAQERSELRAVSPGTSTQCTASAVIRMNAEASGGSAALFPTRSKQAAVSWCVYFMAKCPFK
jgi:hypothetical protein